MRALVSAAALLAAVGASGCGLLFDGVYRLGDGHHRKTVQESSPLDQTMDRREYQAVVEPDGGLRLDCYARTRRVERSWEVTKTYRYRGGFDGGAYIGAAVADVVIGGLIAGALFGMCQSDTNDISCWNMVYAAPFALDLGYSLIRHMTVEPSVLVDKRSSADSLRLAEAPLAEEETACESIASLWLGTATGATAEQILSGHGEGRPALAVDAGAIEVHLDADRRATLPVEAVEAWAGRSLKLWVVEHDDVAHEVAVDRCAVLRPRQSNLSPAALQSFQRACAPPQAAAAR